MGYAETQRPDIPYHPLAGKMMVTLGRDTSLLGHSGPELTLSAERGENQCRREDLQEGLHAGQQGEVHE